MPLENAAGSRPERRDEPGHEDRTEAEQGGLARRRGDAEPLLAELVGVGDEHDGGLHGHAEQREKADPRRHGEGRAAQPQREHAAERCGEEHAGHRDRRELEVVVQREEEQEDQRERDGDDDAELAARRGVLLVFAAPHDAVA